jgi:hypothetical protein
MSDVSGNVQDRVESRGRSPANGHLMEGGPGALPSRARATSGT